MGAGKKQTIGYWYNMGLHYGIGHGEYDALVEIWGGGREAWKGNQTTSGRIFINKPKLWGGEKQEGGIVGALDVMMGEQTQQPNDYLASRFGTKQSAFRGLTTLVFRGGKVGAMNPYPKPWSFRWRRVLKGWDANGVWYPEKAVIPLAAGQVYAMNPAHILYQTLTDLDKGQGEPRGLINDASFRAAADTLHAEGFGLCASYTGLSADDMRGFQQQIVDVIGGALQQSLRDGQYYLDLLRGNYDLASLPIIGKDDILEFKKEASIQNEAINQVVVEWYDPLKRMGRPTTPVRKLGLLASMGGVVGATRTMREIPTEDLAIRVARRELQEAATPRARFTMTVNRRHYALRRATAFRLQYPEEGIADMVCIVGEIVRNERPEPSIKLVAMQDVSHLPDSVYVDPSPGEWVPVSQVPQPAPFRRVFEAPYVELAGNLTAAELAAVPPESGFVAVVGTEPSGLALNYVLATAAQGETYRETNVGDWCPAAIISSASTLIDTAFVLTGGRRLDQVEVGSAALWGSEICRVDAIDVTTGSVTLARGCGDTVPALHVAGERVWFYDAYAASDEREYLNAETVNVKLLTRTPSEQLAVADAPIDSLVMARRAARPYPPANLKIKGVTQPVTDVTDPVSLTWAHRDRVGQADQLVDQNASSIGPEPGTTYTVRAYRGATLLTTTSGISGTANTLVLPPGAYSVRVTVESVRGGLTSTQFQERIFTYAGGLLETEQLARLESEEGDLITIE
ncbi:phage tail protein [Lysobacter sp. CA199]|uniref:phage tail protein n=1 Tax=Lysobacter sp. CA199 TaxID=3455608 RepID=UPI003F8D097A